jgi:carbon-monoxide dehydrogenase large subunit
MNAVLDALSDFGIEHMDMPATPQRVWAAIREARAALEESVTGAAAQRR